LVGSVGGGATGGTWSGGAGSWTNASDPSLATYTAGASETGSITLTLTSSGGSCSTTTATKTITVMEDAYSLLLRKKIGNESFSDTLRRVLSEKKGIGEYRFLFSLC
jgi:hypothetical protein